MSNATQQINAIGDVDRNGAEITYNWLQKFKDVALDPKERDQATEPRTRDQSIGAQEKTFFKSRQGSRMSRVEDNEKI